MCEPKTKRNIFLPKDQNKKPNWWVKAVVKCTATSEGPGLT